MSRLLWGNSPIPPPAGGGSGGFVERDGLPYYRIDNYHRMPPFLMAVPSAYDLWAYVSSRGGLSCGRGDPDGALFPYETDDHLHDADATTGPLTLLRVSRGDREWLWKPFSRDVPVYAVQRHLYRSRFGNRLVFEEINEDLGLEFSREFAAGDRFGFSWKMRLRNLGGEACRIELLDGLRNLLPAGVSSVMQRERSTLVDAYKQAEAVPGACAALFTLSSVPIDRAEPCEALRATTAWVTGLDAADILLSERQLEAFSAGGAVQAETFVRGQRGAFIARSVLELESGGQRGWHLAADVGLGPVEVRSLLDAIAVDDAGRALDEDVRAGSRRLLQLAGGADACQCSSDAHLTTRHFSNTLFNIMRGGVFPAAYRVPVADFLEFVGQRNRPLLAVARQLPCLGGGTAGLERLFEEAGQQADPDLLRVVMEYLPLAFSRRHGDPSRPWNAFRISVRKPDGSERLDYQGNWRDIFQNWEALSFAYPGYLPSFVAKFVNASTVDGYNPYRLSRNGFDWEVFDRADPWSHFGYWGDHQVNYLGDLLEFTQRYEPGRLASLLDRDLFVYADLPYRIRPHEAIVKDPRNSMDYDDETAARIARRVASLGSDGQLAVTRDGSLARANLLEKLLVAALVKLANLVPGGGIWMNTQRPEWNDANNALAGHGLSVVTLCYLRRFLVLLADLLGERQGEGFVLARELACLLQDIRAVFEAAGPPEPGAAGDRQRRAFVDRLGAAAEEYRFSVYRGLSGERERVAGQELLAFLASALSVVDATLGGSRRDDGLFHSYRLLRFHSGGVAVEELDEMLEGQVAVLNSGYLDGAASLSLVESLQRSRLFRPDQGSYLLYPDRRLPGFLEKNRVPAEALDTVPGLDALLEQSEGRYLVGTVESGLHFHPRYRNATELRAALEADPGVLAQQAENLCALYEQVFGHHRFTGRSGSMYKYEGLGCIYWHMVSKLALAIARLASAAAVAGDADLASSLAVCLDRVREGLGMHKQPREYGAFPADPYSHTPSFAGVQQPGMTGQVKEDFLCRMEELGVSVSEGRIRFRPALLTAREFLAEPARWTRCDGGEVVEEILPAGSLGFTVCGVPVVYRRADSAAIRVHSADGAVHEIGGGDLGRDWSAQVFRREPAIRRIEVDIPSSVLR